MPRDLASEAGAVFRFIAERTSAEAVSEARIAGLAGGAVLRHHRLDFILRGGSMPVAEPLFMCCDATVLGAPFFLMRRLPGVTDGMTIAQAGENVPLAEALAQSLARLHGIAFSERLRCLGTPPADAAAARLAALD